MESLATGLDVRHSVRSGRFTGQTAGQAPDHLQGNVVILPIRYAADFLQFCLNNPKSCPLIGISNPGETAIPSLGHDMDLRCDIPRYRVFSKGALAEEVHDISNLWREDFVTFVLGCSFTFEEALIRNGYRVRHIEQGSNVPMFKTTIETTPAGVFCGPLVVTMRSFKRQSIPAIFDLSAEYPHAHGTPIHWGNPQSIGIPNLQAPDFGDAVVVPEDEVPVFWACGVTPQAAIARAQPELCITHAPGCMLVTDLASTAVPDVAVSLSRFWPEETVQ